MASPSKSIPVFLVTGFLGSGKTTFLRRLAETQPERQMVFLVNELAELDVDGAALAGLGRPTHAVVGGSVFCECKAGDFLRVIKEDVLPLREQGRIDAVVIETSGTADPEAIGSLFESHGLEDDFIVGGIVTIVSPKRFETLLRNLPVVESQIRFADRIILNKTDLCDSATVDGVEQRVRSLNPDALIERTSHCRVAADWLERERPLPGRDLFDCEANPYTAVFEPLRQAVGEARLRAWLKELPDFVFRVKGICLTENGFRRIEKTIDSFEMVSCRGNGAETGLVFIVPDAREEQIDHILAGLPRSV